MAGRDDPREDAFTTGLRACLPRLYRYASHLCPHRDAAADAVQEAVVRALERRQAYDPSRPLLPWVLTLVRHAIVDRARSFDPVGRASVLDPSEPGVAGPSVDPLQAAATAQASARLQAALGRLPVDQRSAVVLFYLEGLTLDEIAAVEDVAVGTIKSRLHRAREALAALLDPSMEEAVLWN